MRFEFPLRVHQSPSPVEENVTTENLKKLARIRDEFRGRYYTIEEMSNMSGVPVDQCEGEAFLAFLDPSVYSKESTSAN